MTTLHGVEKRTLICDPVEAKTRADGGRKIGGYAAVFYRQDTPGSEYPLWDNIVERIMPEAFDKALKRGDDVRALFNHDPNHVLGRLTAGTLRLEKSKRGLRYEVDIPDTQLGRDLLVSVDRGDITGSSFAFVVDRESWSREDDLEIREIRSVSLLDVSPVTYPAYTATTAGMRAEDLHEAKRMHQEWYSAEKEQIEQARESQERKQEQCWKYIRARLRAAELRR